MAVRSTFKCFLIGMIKTVRTRFCQHWRGTSNEVSHRLSCVVGSHSHCCCVSIVCSAATSVQQLSATCNLPQRTNPAAP